MFIYVYMEIRFLCFVLFSNVFIYVYMEIRFLCFVLFSNVFIYVYMEIRFLCFVLFSNVCLYTYTWKSGFFVLFCFLICVYIRIHGNQVSLFCFVF